MQNSSYDTRTTKEIIFMLLPNLHKINEELHFKIVYSLEGNGIFQTFTYKENLYELRVVQKKERMQTDKCDGQLPNDEGKNTILIALKEVLNFFSFNGVAFHKGKLMIEDKMKSYEVNVIKKKTNFK